MKKTPTQFNGYILSSGKWCFPREEFLRCCEEMGEFTIIVCRPDEVISTQQKKWYRMTIRKLSERTGESFDYWNAKIKYNCGKDFFSEADVEPNEDGSIKLVFPTIETLNRQDMSSLIDNMIAFGQQHELADVIVPPNIDSKYLKPKEVENVENRPNTEEDDNSGR